MFKIYKSRIYFFFLLVILCFGTLGCGNKANKHGSKISDDGRSYGGLIEGEMNEKIETAFFDLKVLDAVRYETYPFADGLYQAEDGNTYLVITLFIENTYKEDIAMSITDFTLDFEGNKSSKMITGYGNADLVNDDFMDNIFTLKEGESITKSILFTVKNKKNYSLQYKEFYEDEFEGDSYDIRIISKKASKEHSKEETNNISKQE